MHNLNFIWNATLASIINLILSICDSFSILTSSTTSLAVDLQPRNELPSQIATENIWQRWSYFDYNKFQW